MEVRFWYNPATDNLYDFGYEHYAWVFFNHDKLGITKRTVRKIEDSGNTRKLVQLALTKGWVRGKYFYPEIGTRRVTGGEIDAQGTDLKSIQRFTKKILDLQPDANVLYYDIHNPNDELSRADLRFWERDVKLAGDRLEFFLKTAKIPRGTMFENVDKRSAVFTFGRFNPPTIGHKKLIDTVVALAEQKNVEHFIFPSMSHDNERNPLAFEQKVVYMRQMFPDANIIENNISNPWHAAKWLSESGFTDVTMVAGDDRAKDFYNGINTYVGHPDPEKNYAFEKFDVVSAGERDPDSDDIDGMSASKVREFALNEDFHAFRKAIPTDDESLALDIFEKVKQGLEITESLTETQQIRKVINAVSNK